MKIKRLLILAACVVPVVLLVRYMTSPKLGRSESAQTPFMTSMPQDMRQWVAAPGRVEPISDELRLGFDISGILKDLTVDEGDQVTRGQILAELFADEYKQRLESARAQVKAKQAEAEKTLTGSRSEEKLESQAALMQAEAIMSNALVEYQRRAILLEKNLIAKETVDRAQTEYNTAKTNFDMRRQQYLIKANLSRKEDVAIALANLEYARAQEREAMSLMDKTVLRSPIDGVILKVHRREGEPVSEFFETGVLTVGDLRHLRLRAEVDEHDIALVKVGQRAYARADAFGDTQFWGYVERVGRMLGRKRITTDDPSERVDSKVLEVLITFNGTPPLVPGLRMDTYIDLNTPPVAVPEKDQPQGAAAASPAAAAPAPELLPEKPADAAQ